MNKEIEVTYFGEIFFCGSVDSKSFDLSKEQKKLFHVLIHNQEGLTLGVTLDEIEKAVH